MNWKNLSLEAGYVKQEINLNGHKAVSYIPLEQVDSFGIVSSENKKWLYAGCFVGFISLVTFFSKDAQPGIFLGMLAAGLIAVYFITRQTWLTVTSNQTKFSVQVITSKEEVMAVDAFVEKMKESIYHSKQTSIIKAA